MEKIECPSCGYSPEEGETLEVVDENTAIAQANLEGGKLKDPDWELTNNWKEEELVICPDCSYEAPMYEWGLKWNWE